MNVSRLTSGTASMVLVSALACVLVLSSGLSSRARAPQENEDPGSRHICPVEAMRNGTCDPNPNRSKSGSPTSAQRKQPQYKRVAKQTSTAGRCNNRVKEAQTAKNRTECVSSAQAVAKVDLPLSSQRIGVTIWKIREAQRGYNGVRILWHPAESKPAVEYQAERISGEPVLDYGERVRLGIESPRDGYLYVFDRELYHDGSLSAP